MSSNSTFPGDAGPPFGPGAPALDTSTKQTGIITAWVVMTVFAAITVGLRFYTRRLIIHVLGIEDWLILAAMVCCRRPEPLFSEINFWLQILGVGSCVGFIRRKIHKLIDTIPV